MSEQAQGSPEQRIAAMRERRERLERAAEIERAETGAEPETEVRASAAAARRSELERAAMVETAIQQAIRQGKFDDLPGAGKPLPGLGGAHDPDWWIRRKIETEHLSGLGPPALMLRVEHAQLDERLDRLTTEDQVRQTLEDFNRRVIEARRQLLGGPPVVTPTRDVDAEIVAWRARREARRAAEREQREARERSREDEKSRRRRTRRRRRRDSLEQ